MNMPNNPNNLMMQFNQFMQQMRGQNPNAILNQLLQSGRVSQQQLNEAHKIAKNLESQLGGFKNNFMK